MQMIQEIDQEYIAHTYARFPVTFVRGEGALLYDEHEKQYIDMGAGIAVNTFGAADAVWREAVASQLGKLQHTSNLYYTEPCAKLAEALCRRTGLKRVFFANSGAEANECAIKAARKYAFMKYGDESHATIITLKHSFHGRTITTLAATGQDAFHTCFGPFTEGFAYADPEELESLEKIASANNCCAVLFELVQGEGGVRPLSLPYIEEIKRICEKYGLLMMIDEVQTGNGRTGSLYCYEQYGLSPDVVTTAKGLGGGLPLGAVLFGERTKDVYDPGSHGSTFGGNPVCCAGALSILDRLDDALFAEVKRKGELIKDLLSDSDEVTEITGLGLMMGIKTKRPAKEVAMACLEKGVLVLTAKDKIRLVPPLIISDEQIKEAIDILKETLKENSAN
ncbi:MAG: acetylornithine/succinylornithine family transaminase [Clostridiales bacterium]|nr:acetylornithine/succinylornithine family transaminase [Clostridiales bacterium]